MPGQIIPIQDIASAGVVQDTPSVTLPPNVFSDVRNVRFEDGAVRKMPGESDEITNLLNVQYVAYWNHPVTPRYVVVTYLLTDTSARVRTYGLNGIELDGGTTKVIDITAGDPLWQHTMFNGGFTFILNNGISTPKFLQDDLTGFVDLPGWDSYLSQSSTTSVVWSVTNSEITLGPELDFTPGTGEVLDVVITPRSSSVNIITYTISALPAGAEMRFSFDTADDQNWLFIPGLRSTTNTQGALEGDTISLTRRRIPAIRVRAGVIRSYGSLLVIGNLMETDRTDTTVVRRRMPGVIRTSDVAAPGTVPTNWNPFRNGVNTADEFTLASTGRVVDMAELQGVLYVYTDSSIHAIQQTGQIALPFQIQPVTFNYGAQNVDSVLEVDGKHIVVGSNDIYVFAGHPGSISSISDSRVRHQPFWDNDEIRIERFSRYDELWFWSPTEAFMYVWNYRDNTWTIREQTAPVSGTTANGEPIFASSTTVFSADTGFSTEDAYVERRRLAMAPEFTTENLASIATLVDGNGELNFQVLGSNAPGEVAVPSTAEDKTFMVATDYKQDIRVHGRFLNYRITHVADATDQGFNLSGMQFDVGSGGTR